MTLRIFLALGLCTVWPAAAQPEIFDSGVTNAASYAVPQAPGSGIAPGAIFVVFGSRLGPETLQQAPGYPLPTELAGTRVRIGGTAAYLLYTSSAQIAAIAPSALGPGSHDVTVSFNNQTSAPFSVRVVETDFGIFTRNAAGYGQVAAQTVLPDGSVRTLGLAAGVRTGEPVVLYGTGLGAIAGASDDEPPGARTTTARVEVIIGGRIVQPNYAGRSPAFAGLDQINFNVPAGIEAGCYVAAAVIVNGRLSNVATIPVARTGRNCSHPFGLPEPAMQTLDSGGSVIVAQAIMERQSSPEGGGEGAGIGFAQMDANALETMTPKIDDPYAGTPEPAGCSVQVQNLDRTIPRRPRVSRPVFLDAGATAQLTGPSFSADLHRVPLSTYGTNLPPGTLRAGTWLYAGTGGSDIGSYQMSVELPEPLTWTNRQETVLSSQPLTIEWSGGGPEPVRITGSAALEGPEGLRFASFTCAVSGSARTFTIPAEILSALPAGASGGINVSQAVTRGGFDIPLARGGTVDGSGFLITYTSSGRLQLR